MVNITTWKNLRQELDGQQVTLVAVSKTKSNHDILSLYQAGERNFGENYVQELVEKQAALPQDINWHFIGHLQTNKVKYIATFVHLIHAVDSFKLLQEINKQAGKHERVIDVLLQLHIAEEETKYGLTKEELVELLEYYKAQQQQLPNVRIRGLMTMATFTDDEGQVRKEFASAHNIFRFIKDSYFITDNYFDTCSMGMSGDYRIAVEEGSTMVRIGSMVFGARN